MFAIICDGAALPFEVMEKAVEQINNYRETAKQMNITPPKMALTAIQYDEYYDMWTLYFGGMSINVQL